jgi:hypothetical protein
VIPIGAGGSTEAKALDFDPRLPDLPLVLDLAGVGELFGRRWFPANGSAQPAAVQARRLMDAKYEPGRRCVAVYELALRSLEGPSVRTIGVLQVTTSGAEVRLFSDDPQLPWLKRAVDPRVMAERLGRILGLHSTVECVLFAVRYKPGARCTIQLEFRNDVERNRLFGKTFASGSSRLMATLEALHLRARNDSRMPGVVPPVAHLPDLHMVIQPAVEGGEVHTAAFDPSLSEHERLRLVGRAGAALAGFHAVADAPGPPRTLGDDLDELRAYGLSMAQAAPALSEEFVALIDRASMGTADGAGSLTVASHGAFRTDQLLDGSDGLVMIDLDGFCHSSAGRDIGNFLAYLRWRAMRQPEHDGFVEQARAAFVTGYDSVRAAPDPREMRVYEAASLLKIAGRRYRNLSVGEWPRVPLLLKFAGRLLGG